MISVVMPAYNTERYIGEAVESILNQTYRDFEFIIVDDGSTDRTGEIVRQYAAQDARIRVIDGPHAGASAAMNLGIAEAQGDWVAVMHSDDIALPERLEKQLAAAQASPEVVVWGTHAYRISSDGRRLAYFPLGPENSAQFHQMRNHPDIVQVIHPTAMMRRDILQQVGGYDQSIMAGEDSELFDRMLVHGELRVIPEVLLYYRIHGSSLSATRYMEMYMYVRFIRARQQHRLDGKPGELTLAEFKAMEAALPWWKRLNTFRRNLSGLYYRHSGLMYGEKRLLAFVWHLGIAFVLAPPRTVRRLKAQKLTRHGINKDRLDVAEASAPAQEDVEHA